MRFGFSEVDIDLSVLELLAAGIAGVMIICGPLILKVILGMFV